MMQSITRMFAERVQAHPDRLYVDFHERGQEVGRLTYGATWAWASRWATTLGEHGVVQGDRVILALPNTADFVGAFFGTLLAGATPAAVPPLRASSTDDPTIHQLVRRIELLDARALVVSEPAAGLVAQHSLAQRKRFSVLSARDLTSTNTTHTPQGRSEDVALLQFTSGTAGPTKVVQLRHSALLAQIAGISKALSLDPDEDSAVSWLPLFHDMGLIGFMLTPAFIGRHVTVLRVEDFATRPALWMRALSETGATITGGPPSAFSLCTRRIRQADMNELDLSRLRVALVGAEMVAPASLEAFAEKFADCGLRRSSLTPTYGLAENGLAVTIPALDRGPRFDSVDLRTLITTGRAEPASAGVHRRRDFAAVGRPIPGIEVLIIDGKGLPAEDRSVGEVVVRGPTLMSGYLHQPEASQAVLRDGWLHTGDLGYLVDGELHITGRSKEVLIVGGRNHYPEDLEQLAAAVQGVRAGKAVAISVHDADTATEAVVVLAETALTDPVGRDRLRQDIRHELARAEYPVDRVVLLPPRTITSTASGKLMRIDCRRRFLAGEFT